MYFELLCVCSAVACVLAAPFPGAEPLEKQQPTVIPIVSQSEELESNGTYKFSYETGNGIKREEVSYDKIVPKAQGRSAGSGEGSDSNESDEIHVQIGSYSYTAPDGTVITVRYIADENGFRPVGDHLPKAPALVQQAQENSAEKSGRALKVDNTESGSEPKATIADEPAGSPESEEPPEEAVSIESRLGASPDTPASQSASSTIAPAKSSTSKPEGTSSEASAATEISSTTVEATSTPAIEQSTPEAISTEEPKEATTSEASSTTVQLTSTEATSTESSLNSESTTSEASTTAST